MSGIYGDVSPYHVGQAIEKFLSDPDVSTEEVGEAVGIEQGQAKRVRLLLKRQFGEEILGSANRQALIGMARETALEVMEDAKRETASHAMIRHNFVEDHSIPDESQADQAVNEAMEGLEDEGLAKPLDSTKSLWSLTEDGVEEARGELDLQEIAREESTEVSEDLRERFSEDGSYNPHEDSQPVQPLAEGDIFELEVEKFGEKGDPMGWYDGYVIFVKETNLNVRGPICDPGDIVRCRLIEQGPNFGVAREREIVEAKQDREAAVV